MTSYDTIKSFGDEVIRRRSDFPNWLDGQNEIAVLAAASNWRSLCDSVNAIGTLRTVIGTADYDNDSANLQSAIDEACSDNNQERHIIAIVGQVNLNPGINIGDPTETVSPKFAFVSMGGFISLAPGFTFTAYTSDVWWIGLRFDTQIPGQHQFLKYRADAGEYSRWRWRSCQFNGVALGLGKSIYTDHLGVDQNNGTGVSVDAQIVDCKFNAVYASEAMLVNAAKDVLVSRCQFYDCGISTAAGDSIKISSGSESIVVENSLIDGSKRDGIDVYDSWKTRFINNVVRNAGVMGYEAKWQASANPVKYHEVIGCLFEGCGETGCAMSASYGTVIGCTSVGCKQGFRTNQSMDLTDTYHVKFVGNRAVENEYGFIDYGNKTTFVANDCIDNTDYGYALLGSNTLFEKSNTYRGNGVSDVLPTHASVTGILGRTGFYSGNWQCVEIDNKLVLERYEESDGGTGTGTSLDWVPKFTFTAAGSILYGDTVYQDYRVDMTQGRTQGSSNIPELVKVSDNGAGSFGLYAYAFDASTVEQLRFDVQLPHNWKAGSTIHPHIHWIPMANGSAGQTVSWGLEYEWVSLGGVFSQSTLIYGNATTAGDASLVAKKHYLTPIGDGIVGTGKTISSVLMCRIFRDATGAGATDSYTADAVGLSFDIHYEIDRASGSSELYSQ